MTKTLAFVLMFILTTVLPSLCLAGPETAAPPIVGIAWRGDTDTPLFTSVCMAVEEAGGLWVLLDQVRSPDLSYDAHGKLLAGVDAYGILEPGSAKQIRCNSWHGSNAGEAVGDIGLVIFSGGEDISPSLYYSPQEWHGILEEMDYNAERDVSDYLTMSYCLDHDIPVLGICRGMQMLSVISGAEFIQDIPAFLESHGLGAVNSHRDDSLRPDGPGSCISHDVEILRGSLLYRIYGTDVLKGCVSFHHQAILNVDDTRLVVTGTADTQGLDMIEAIERTDKTCAIGLQFHPEIALIKHLDHEADEDEFMDYQTALRIFSWFLHEPVRPSTSLEPAA